MIGKVILTKFSGSNQIRIYFTKQAIEIMGTYQIIVKKIGDKFFFKRPKLDSKDVRTINKKSGIVSLSMPIDEPIDKYFGKYYIDSEDGDTLELIPISELENI